MATSGPEAPMPPAYSTQGKRQKLCDSPNAATPKNQAWVIALCGPFGGLRGCCGGITGEEPKRTTCIGKEWCHHYWLICLELCHATNSRSRCFQSGSRYPTGR